MRNLSLKRLKSKSKQKTKKRTQRGGGMRFWKKLFLGPFWRIGEPRRKSKSKPKSPPKSKSKSPPTPKLRPNENILFDEYKNLTLSEKKLNQLSSAEYKRFVKKIKKHKKSFKL